MFVKGKSGNPKGRPKKGASLAEMVRMRVPVEELVDFARTVMKDRKQRMSDRLVAHHWLADRGHGRAPQHVSVDLPGDPGALTLDKIVALLDEDGLRALERALVVLEAAGVEIMPDGDGGQGKTATQH